MAKSKVYGFGNERDIRDVKQATRQTLGTARTGARRTRRQPILEGGGRGGSGTDGTDGGGGFLSASCDCLPMVNLPGTPSVCCEGSLMFETASVFLGAIHELKYNPDDQWSTDPAGFEFDECLIDDVEAVNKYRITITASADPWGSTMQVELVEDNGCPVICALYKSPYPFRCGCNNQFVRVTFDNIIANRLPCTIVVKPKSTSFAVTPQDWGNDVLCGIVPAHELPLGWSYTHDDFDGARCMPPGQRDFIYKYSGEYGGTTPIWGNANAPRGFPLLRSSGFGFWQSPDVHGTSGVLVGAVPDPVYARTTLEITCGGSLTFTLKIRGVAVPLTGGQEGGPIVTYQKIIPLADVEPSEIACLLNADHTLTRSGGGSTDPQNGFCVGEWDPVFDPLSIPTSVDISPFGGGPEECPNPDEPEYGDPPTTEGYCGSPCTTPTAEPDPEGEETCCVDSTCFDDLTGTDCTDIGGEIVASCDDCDKAWACCHEGSCYHMTETECISMVGNEFSFHEGDLCADTDCEVPEAGSCCGSCGSCTDGATAEDCAAELFHATACSGVTCPENVGACCTDGVCTIRSSGNCPGDYQGDCTECAGVNCSQLGACCHPNEGETDCLCTDNLDASICSDLAGVVSVTWLGAGTTCAGDGEDCDKRGFECDIV